MSVYVKRGIFVDGYLKVSKKLVPISDEKFLEVCERLKPYLLALEETATTSYDDSDDERATPSSTYTKSVRYRELNPKENAEHLLLVDDEIVGVVFTVKSGNEVYYKAFSFDGTIAQSMRLGWSASHSSSFEYVDRVSLKERGKDGAPTAAKDANFIQSEMYPSL